MSVEFKNAFDDTWVLVTGVTHPARPSHTRHKVKIPGMDGTHDFGGNTAEDFEIMVNVTITAANRTELRVRIIAFGDELDGKDTLTIGGETYQAQVYEMVGFTESMSGTTASGTVIFECDS